MTIDEILKEGERLEREATPGPWVGNVHGEVRAVPLDRLSIGFFSRSYSAGVNGSHEVTADDAEANATFAAFARTALPALLAVCRAAVEWEKAEADNAAPHPDEVCNMGPGDCEPCMAVERRYQRVRAAHDALRAAVRGDAGKEKG